MARFIQSHLTSARRRGLRCSLVAGAFAALGFLSFMEISSLLPSSSSTSLLAASPTTLLNVSYDPTRELYEEINVAFRRRWEPAHGPAHDQPVARRLGQAGPLGHRRPRGRRRDARAFGRHRRDRVEGGPPARDWQARLPQEQRSLTPRRSSSSCARATRRRSGTGTTSRRAGVAVITPNPKTSGGARWNYLAAWGYALKRPGGSERRRASSSRRSSGTCPSSTPAPAGRRSTFAERGIGDVLIAWENEAFLLTKEIGQGSSRSSCLPSASSPSRPSRSWTGTPTSTARATSAQAYLEFLYTDEAQAIAAKHHFGREMRQSRPLALATSRKFPSSRSTTSSADGAGPRRSTSTTAARSTSSISPADERRPADTECFPGSGPLSA